ncbi:MAG TPA: HAD family hydrolase [Candidatus Hydrogenedentes bacterium]|nr:HAD family hydrolase [Candidatus Hydrogenedentota bacterium]
MDRPEAILLDMGGVLLDPADRWDAESFPLSFPNGLPEPAPLEWFLAMSEDIAKTFLALKPPRPVMDVRPFVETWLWRCKTVPTPAAVRRWLDVIEQWEVREVYEFVPGVLATLRGAGFRLGVISNTLTAGRALRAHFCRAGILDFFEMTLFSAEFGVNKPHPALFQHALDCMGLDASKAWYVGDKPQRDICGAHGVGMTTVLVDGPHADRAHDGPEYMPDLRIEDLSALPAVFGL